MSSTDILSAEDVSPQEIAAVEVALRHIERQHTKEKVLGIVAQWFLVLGMFKELETNFTKCKNRATLRVPHRALLTAVMALGEFLLSESGQLSDHDFRATGYTRESFVANMRYLREKYEQWYVDLEAGTMERVWPKLTDEREIDPAKDFQSKA